MSQELGAYLEIAKDLAREAGQVMLEYFENDQNKVQTKSDNTPVTDADVRINKLVVKKISRSFPDHGVIGEEESLEGDGEFNWVCDPIDGTRPFTYGMPFSTFNLALTREGKSLVAVQYDPYMDRLYWASKGTGTYLNGNRVAMPERFEGKVPLNLEIYRGGSSMLQDENVETEVIKALAGDEWYFMKLGSVGYSLGRVACGKFGGAVFSGGAPYEAATGNLLITEAGGCFTNLFGQEDTRYDQPINGFIAAHPVIHQKILEQIESITERFKQS